MGLEVVVGDITRIPVEAIVNAANETLRGGGGVDGAIHRAAGPQLLEACRAYSNCPTGEARVTPAFALPARWVIHTVGPVWRGGGANEDALLAAAYRSSLEAAAELGATSISFPAISTGVYAFPRERAAKIAMRAVQAWIAAGRNPLRIVLVCFDRDSAQKYESLAGAS